MLGKSASADRYADTNRGPGHEGRDGCAEPEVANLPEQVKSIAGDDRAASESPSVVAHGYVDPGGIANDDMHENMASLPVIETVFHRVA
jgi:hypothetical protein